MMSGNPHSAALPLNHFILLSLSSVMIAAAGYIINDYFDLNIDMINKPGRIVVEKLIKRRWAIIWHWVYGYRSAGWYCGIMRDGEAGVCGLFCQPWMCGSTLVLFNNIQEKITCRKYYYFGRLTAWVVMVVGFVTVSRYPHDLSSKYSLLWYAECIKVALGLLSVCGLCIYHLPGREGSERY